MQTIELIQLLTRDTRTIKPLFSPKVRSLLWAILSIATLLFWILVLGFRPDLLGKLSEFRFVFEAVLLLSGGILAGTISLNLCIPGIELKSRLKYCPLLPFLGWFTLLIGILIQGLAQGHALSNTIGWGVSCTRDIFLIGLGPALFLLFLIRRAVPTDPSLTSVLLFISMACLGAVATQFICKNDYAIHLIAWHFFPLAILALLGFILSRRLLRW